MTHIAGYLPSSPTEGGEWDTSYSDGNIGLTYSPPGALSSITPLPAAQLLAEIGVVVNVDTGRDTTMSLGIYEIIDASTKNLLFDFDIPVRAADGTGWRMVTAPLTVDASSWAGKRLGVGRGRPADTGGIGFRYQTAGDSTMFYQDSRGGDYSMPSTFGGYQDVTPELVWAVFEDAELGLDIEPGDFRFSGGAVNLRAQRRLSAAAGDLQFQGGTVGLRAARRLSVAAGNLTFQGGAMGFRSRRVLRADAADLRFSGGAVSLRYHHRMPIDAGDYRFEGQPVTFHRGYRIAADAGDLRFLGGAMGFRVNNRIGADAGELRFAGGDVDMAVLTDGTLNVDAGDFGIEGAVMSLRASRRLPVAAGDLRFEGAEVRALAARRLHVDPGDFRINGMPVNLIAETSITLGADAGVFGFTGSAMSLRLLRHLSTDAGELRFLGGDVELSRDRVLKVEAGNFRISGGRARLIYSGAPPTTGADRGGVTSSVTESIIERIAAA